MMMKCLKYIVAMFKLQGYDALFKYTYLKTRLCGILSTGIKEEQQKVLVVKKLIEQLPRPNQDTMKVLFRHLLRYIRTHFFLSLWSL